MADPTRLQVLKALSSALEEINGPAGGYENDLRPTTEVPRRVFRGRVIFGDDDPLPMLSILEVPVPVEPNLSTSDNVVQNSDWELIIQGFVDDDFVDPTDPAHLLLADVKRRLALEKRRDHGDDLFGFGNKVHELQIGAGVVRPPDETSAKAYFWLNIKLSIAEDLTTPYTPL